MKSRTVARHVRSCRARGLHEYHPQSRLSASNGNLARRIGRQLGAVARSCRSDGAGQPTSSSASQGLTHSLSNFLLSGALGGAGE